MKPKSGINFTSYGWLLDKHFVLSKGIFWLKWELTLFKPRFWLSMTGGGGGFHFPSENSVTVELGQ